MMSDRGGNTQRHSSREILSRLKRGGEGGSLFHAFLGVRSAYRGKLVVTAAQSRSGETVQQQQDRQKGRRGREEAREGVAG